MVSTQGIDKIMGRRCKGNETQRVGFLFALITLVPFVNSTPNRDIMPYETIQNGP